MCDSKKVDWGQFEDEDLEWFLTHPYSSFFHENTYPIQEIGLDSVPRTEDTLIPEFEDAIKHAYGVVTDIGKDGVGGVTHRHKTNTAITFHNLLKYYRIRVRTIRNYRDKISVILINDVMERCKKIEKAFEMIYRAWTTRGRVTHREQKWLTRLYWFPFFQAWSRTFSGYTFAEQYRKLYMRVLKIYKNRPKARCSLCRTAIARYSIGAYGGLVEGKLCTTCYEKLEMVSKFVKTFSRLRGLIKEYMKKTSEGGSTTERARNTKNTRKEVNIEI